MVKTIGIGLILPHPENCNLMQAQALDKLRRHIERTGRYEPIVVRPHPTAARRFQVINGHHRLAVLKSLGQTSVQCIVWDVDDEQARLYLATLNKLSGEDVPERRSLLVSSLLESYQLEDLALLLPENRDQLAELERLAKSEPGDLPTDSLEGKDVAAHVILEFFLEPDRAKRVNEALDFVAHRHPKIAARSDALVQLARFYLRSNKKGARRPPQRTQTH
jgi:ParB/RepB/Spo0J family partition protein